MYTMLTHWKLVYLCISISKANYQKSLMVCLQKGLIFMTIAQEGVTTLIIPGIKKVFTDQAIRTAGPILCNSLNEHLKNVNSVNHFRKQFKTTLISAYNLFIDNTQVYCTHTPSLYYLSCDGILKLYTS